MKALCIKEHDDYKFGEWYDVSETQVKNKSEETAYFAEYHGGYKKFDDAVESVLDDLWNNESQENRDQFINSSKQDLVLYHHTLGRQIRNGQGLWRYPGHKPVLRGGIDFSIYHPDFISMAVIEKVWRSAQDKNHQVESSTCQSD